MRELGGHKLGGHNLSFAEELYARAMDAVAQAEQEEAEAFLARKNEVKPVRSDWEARAMALLDCKGTKTKAQAMADIARHRMEVERASQS